VAQHNSGVVEWGHLKADVVNFGGGSRQYDILAPEEDEYPLPGARGGVEDAERPRHQQQQPPQTLPM
jgi:hypothetical protein